MLKQFVSVKELFVHFEYGCPREEQAAMGFKRIIDAS
jgi:hypothetical protein